MSINDPFWTRRWARQKLMPYLGLPWGSGDTVLKAPLREPEFEPFFGIRSRRGSAHPPM